MLAVFVDGDDVRVRKPARGLRLALEAREDIRRLARLEHLGAQGLDRDPAADDRIEALVHDAHGTAPDLQPDFVLAYFFEHVSSTLCAWRAVPRACGPRGSSPEEGYHGLAAHRKGHHGPSTSRANNGILSDESRYDSTRQMNHG